MLWFCDFRPALTIMLRESNLLHTNSLFMELILIASGSLLALNAFAAGSEAIIRQRAKELSNQNNVRQGVPPPAQPPPQASQTAPPTATLTPMARLQTDIAAIKLNSPATPAQKQQ